MSDHLLAWMKRNGVPITREKYLGLAWGEDLPDPWTPEHEAELPEELQEVYTTDAGFDPSEARDPQGKWTASAAWKAEQQSTPGFKVWFKNSVVVDKEGAPKVVYHGTPVFERKGITYGALSEFNRSASQALHYGGKESIDNVGSWFSDYPHFYIPGKVTNQIGATVYPVYLSIQNPWRPRSFDEFVRRFHEEAGRDPEKQNPRGVGSTAPFRAWLKSQGYDGIEFKKGDVDFPRQKVWVTLESQQTKSAIGNVGTFDPHSGKLIDQLSFDFNPAQPRVPEGSTGGGQWTSGGGMQETTARRFVESRDVSTRQQFLSPHPAEELGGHTLLMNAEGTVGISVDPQGDVQNVFNNGGPKGGAAKAMVAAIEHGGRTLDCYDGFLPGYYAQFGFVEDQRMKFNPKFAPPGWDFAKYDNPDIVFMSWRGYVQKDVQATLERVASRADWVKPTKAESYGDDWDAAKAASRRAANPYGTEGHRPADADLRPPADRAGDRSGTGTGSGTGRAVDFNPYQPRDPAGTPTGGRWSSGLSSGAPTPATQLYSRPDDKDVWRWDKQINNQITELEKAGQLGSAEDDDLQRMSGSLGAWLRTPQVDRDSGKRGIFIVTDFDSERVLATTLVQFNEQTKVALIDFNGAIDFEAKTKSLHEAVKHYSEIYSAKTVEGNTWKDDAASIKAYEQAGFSKSKRESFYGIQRMVWGEDETPTPEPEPDPKMSIDDIQSHIVKVAKDAGFPVGKIRIENGDRVFTLNGKEYFSAGTAYIAARNTPMDIAIWADHVQPWSIDGVIRHEIEHIQFQHALNGQREDLEMIAKEPGRGGGPYGVDEVMKPDGTLKPPYDKQYPIYHAMSSVYSNHLMHEWAAADGVSDYSYEYWKSFKDKGGNFELAVHETLAEMARIKYETGKFPDHMGERIISYRGEDKPKPTQVQMDANAKLWRDLFRTVQTIWKENPLT